MCIIMYNPFAALVTQMDTDDTKFTRFIFVSIYILTPLLPHILYILTINY